MRRIVLDMKGGLLAEAVMQSLSGCDPDFLIYRSSKPEETLALCRTCRANVLVMEVIRQAVKDQLVDDFIYASVSPTYLAGVIDTL